ncbi:MAG: Cna B-type domain-containing protein [Faecousia sp.]
MTRKGKMIAAAVCLLVLLVGLPMPAKADGAPDIRRSVSLTITHAYEGKALSGVPFRLYLLATMDETGALTAVPPFGSYINDAIGGSASVWADAAAKLEQDMAQGKLKSVKPVDQAKTNSRGVVSFPSAGKSLTPGLYFIPGTRTEKSGYVYETSPILVSLPNAFDGVWVYDQTIDNTKPERVPAIRDIKVIKVWQDSCHPGRRPESITVHLMCDGERYDTITLPYQGKWEYVWKDLEANHSWTVTEDRVTGYKEPTVKISNGVITMTNTCNRPGKHHNTKLPQTGQLWWPVPVLIAVGLALVVVGLVRRRKDEDED